MDNQTPQSISYTSSGHENHGVHVCHKCRWPFPNPHPSAKQRRSHKKVCGTIEGYKLGGVDLEGSAQSNVSDDEPNPRTLGDPAINEAKALIPSAIEIQSTDCGPIIGLVTESIQVKHSEVASEFLGPESSIVNPVSDSQTEDFHLRDSCGNASSEEVKPIKSETQKDALAKQGTDAEGKIETRSDISYPGLNILPSEAENDSANSDDLAEKNEVFNVNVHVLSVPNDIHETNNAEIMLEDFKDHKVKSNQSATSGFEIAKERDDTEDLLAEDVLLKELPVEEEARLNEHKGPDEIDRAILVSCHPGKESSEVFEETSRGHFSGDAKNLVSGVNSVSTWATESNLSRDHVSLGVNETDYADSPSAEKLSELESDRETDFQNIRACGPAEIEKHKTTNDSGRVKDAIEVSGVDGSKQESFSENAAVLESGNKILEPSVDHATETQKHLPENACTDSRNGCVDTASDTKLVVPENDLVDSSSQTDSLENNWGSVSVISAQSAAQALIDATESQAVTGERINSKQSKLSSEGHSSDKSEMFEAPSFMTLVEPRGDAGQKPIPGEIKASQNPKQPSSSALQAGWFPSITNVVNESQGRKKNEEIIAKVTNWSAAVKQHTPLKSLLGEASQDAKAKSPKRRESQTPTTGKVNSVLVPESPVAQTAEREIEKEWNSPARYRTEIKREKRKPRSRPYWAQFMCCSSVH